MAVFLKARLLWRLVLTISVGVGIGIYSGFWIVRGADTAPIEVRQAVRAVIRAEYLGSVIGEYWEDELIRQYVRVSTLPEKDRLQFYKIVMINCDLSNYRAIYFSEVIGRDAILLQKYLQEFVASDEFRSISNKSQENLLGWIALLPIIEQQWKQETVWEQSTVAE